jgi:hypothetical protein
MFRFNGYRCISGLIATGFVLAFVGALGAANAMADSIAFAPPSTPTDAGEPNDAVNLGLVFTADSTFSVDALGIFDQSDLTSSEVVGLYNSSGTLLRSATVTLGDPLVGGYLFQSITPITLTAGSQYTVVAFTGPNDWSYGSTPPTANADVTYNFHDYDYTSSLAFPTTTAGAAGGATGTYYGPNFEIATGITSTPEPSTLMLLAISLLGLVAMRRFFL